MSTTRPTRTRRQTANGANGAKWIRQSTRLALYLRDGMACAWCGAGLEAGAALTLDHILPRSAGGSHDATNLVTSCLRCNSARGNRDLGAFARSVAGYLNHGITSRSILAHVRECTERPLPRREARDLIARRGSYAAALKG